MTLYLQERYVNLWTGFGFSRVFVSESNIQLLVNFLNTLLPVHHKIRTLSYKGTEILGNVYANRTAILDLYCQGENGERFIVELQRAKHNFFKNDRSIFYASFPIQEKALKGDWNFEAAPVYSIGILDFVFKDHKDQRNFSYTAKLENHNSDEDLTCIYIELPKFEKTLTQLKSQQDKWLYLFKHLPELDSRPQLFQEPVFLRLFEVAEIANFSPEEEDAYETSLKYYRDLNNVVETARMEGQRSVDGNQMRL